MDGRPYLINERARRAVMEIKERQELCAKVEQKMIEFLVANFDDLRVSEVKCIALHARNFMFNALDPGLRD